MLAIFSGISSFLAFLPCNYSEFAKSIPFYVSVCLFLFYFYQLSFCICTLYLCFYYWIKTFIVLFWYMPWSFDIWTQYAGSQWLKTCLLRQCGNISEAHQSTEGLAKLLWSLQFKCSSWHSFLKVLVLLEKLLKVA